MSPRASLPLLVLAIAPAGAIDDENPAITAAREREQAVRTARFEVHVREVRAKGLASDSQPAEDVVHESDNLLLFGGGNIRVEYNRPKWTGSGFTSLRLVETAEGKQVTVFLPDGKPDDRTPTASIRDTIPYGPVVVRDFLWIPVTGTVRGLSPEAELFPVREFRPTGATELIDGDRCREYTAPHGASKSELHYWLARDMGHVLRRARVVNEGQVAQQLDVRYRRDDVVGWLPSDWVSTVYGPDGRAEFTTTVTLTATRLNESLPQDAFRITFPPGTRISDGTRKYVVEPDGTWRKEEPVNKSPLSDDSPPPVPEIPWRRALVAGLFVVIGLCVLLAVWLRLRRFPPA